MNASDARTAAPASAQRAFRQLSALLPGVATCATVALAAGFVADHYGGPTMLYALLLGMAFNHLADQPRYRPGIELIARTVLRIGVALLGVRITVAQIGDLGFGSIMLIVLAVACTISFGVVFARLLGLRSHLGVLTGGAVAICGASAAMALAAVLPKHAESERHTLLTVVVVTALSTSAMVIYPTLTTLFGLDAVQTGIFLGGTIHDVAQVVGAGYMISPATGDVATLVKLTRVALLFPATVAVAIAFARSRKGSGANTPTVPWFLFGFLALLLLNTVGLVPTGATAPLNDISRACLVAAIAALGIKTSFANLAALGWKPVVLMTGETLFLACIVLLGVVWMA